MSNSSVSNPTEGLPDFPSHTPSGASSSSSSSEEAYPFAQASFPGEPREEYENQMARAREARTAARTDTGEVSAGERIGRGFLVVGKAIGGGLSTVVAFFVWPVLAILGLFGYAIGLGSIQGSAMWFQESEKMNATFDAVVGGPITVGCATIRSIYQDLGIIITGKRGSDQNRNKTG